MNVSKQIDKKEYKQQATIKSCEYKEKKQQQKKQNEKSNKCKRATKSDRDDSL